MWQQPGPECFRHGSTCFSYAKKKYSTCPDLGLRRAGGVGTNGLLQKRCVQSPHRTEHIVSQQHEIQIDSTVLT